MVHFSCFQKIICCIQFRYAFLTKFIILVYRVSKLDDFYLVFLPSLLLTLLIRERGAQR